MRRKISKSTETVRNRKLVSLVEKGLPVTKLGKLFGISRERVCQLYFSDTGMSVRELRTRKRLEAIEAAQPEPKVCVVCGVTLFSGRRYCSKEHRNEFYGDRRSNRKVTCSGCGVKFHPYYTAKYTGSKRHYHNLACYHKNGGKYGNK